MTLTLTPCRERVVLWLWALLTFLVIMIQYAHAGNVDFPKVELPAVSLPKGDLDE